MGTPIVDYARLAALREPHAIYVSGEDGLRMTSLSSSAGAIVLSGRFLDLDGRVRPFEQRAVLGNDRSTVATTPLQLGEGWLLNLTAVLEAGTVGWAQAFLRVDLVRGFSGAIQTLATLMQGTVTDTQRRAWPGSPIAGTLEAPGTLRVITGTNPAAGAEVSETVPAGARWHLRGFTVGFTTDATVANRETHLLCDDGTNVIFRAPPSAVQAASVSATVTASSTSALPGTASGVRLIGLSDSVRLGPGYRIRTSTLNLQAGDDYAAPTLLVEEWLEGV